MSFKNIKNCVDFYLRNHFSWSRKNYVEKNEDKIKIFDEPDILERFETLNSNFDLDYLIKNSTKINFLENLYILDILDKYFPISFNSELSILDIGCRNWSYVKGENAFFKKYCNHLEISGIELDFNRLYYNLYSRAETAKFYLKGTNAKYIKGDFLNLEGNFDYITWFLPYMFYDNQLSSGLPLNNFLPQEMLIHAYELLNSKGKIFIVNQGFDEYELQISLLMKFAIQYKELGKIESKFLKYKNLRYGLIIEKPL